MGLVIIGIFDVIFIFILFGELYFLWKEIELLICMLFNIKKII